MTFECRFQGCTNVYRGPSQREYHERRHQSAQDRFFSCNFDGCSYRAYQYANLKAHASAPHRQDPSGLSHPVRPIESVQWIHPSKWNGAERKATAESLSALPRIFYLPTVPWSGKRQHIPLQQPRFDPTIHCAPSSSATIRSPDFHGNNLLVDIRHKVPNNDANSLGDEQRQGHGATVPSIAPDQDWRVVNPVTPVRVQSSSRLQRFEDISRDLPCPWEQFNAKKRVERSSDYIPSPDPRLLFG